MVYPPGWYAWSSTTQGNSGDHLNLQDDGNLVIYSASGSPLWATMTGDAPQGYAASGDPYPYGQCTYWVDEAARSYRGTYLYGYLGTHGIGRATPCVTATRPATRRVSVGRGVPARREGRRSVWARRVGHRGLPPQDAIQVTEMDFPGLGKVDTRVVYGAFNYPGLSYIYLYP